jgi:hypothetical protein
MNALTLKAIQARRQHDPQWSSYYDPEAYLTEEEQDAVRERAEARAEARLDEEDSE